MATQDFIDFAAKVAASLGMSVDETWEADWNGVRITDGRDRGYHLAPVRGNSDRTEIRMVFDPGTQYWFDRGDRKPIFVSRSRGPEAVAADITRRLAPRYEALLVKVHAWDLQRQAEDAARLAIADAIVAGFPTGSVSLPSHLQGEARTTLLLYGPGHLGGEVRMHSEADVVEFSQLRVPAGVAVRMLAIYASVFTPREAR